jgi:hypothetical protein
LCVLGSIPELGNWNKDGSMATLKPNMVWTEGHIWQLETPIKTNIPFFRYKYYLIDKINEHESAGWEKGIDRIADVRELASGSNNGNLVIQDEWQMFKVRYSIYYPLSTPQTKVFMSTKL